MRSDYLVCRRSFACSVLLAALVASNGCSKTPSEADLMVRDTSEGRDATGRRQNGMIVSGWRKTDTDVSSEKRPGAWFAEATVKGQEAARRVFKFPNDLDVRVYVVPAFGAFEILVLSSKPLSKEEQMELRDELFRAIDDVDEQQESSESGRAQPGATDNPDDAQRLREDY